MNQEKLKSFIDSPATDAPIHIPVSRYDEVIEYLVHKWKNVPVPPEAIYQIGGVNAPGISDLDLLLVFQDGVSIDWLRYNPYHMPAWVREVITHSPYFSTFETWKDLGAWFPIFNMKHVWGENLSQNIDEYSGQIGIALGMLIDYLIVKVPRDILYIALEKPLRQRTLICLLHSVKYIFLLAEHATVKIPEGSLEFIRKIDALRARWFELSKKEQMLQLAQVTEEGIYLSSEQIKLLDKELSDEMEWLGESKLELGSRNSLFWFKNPWVIEDILITSGKDKSNNYCNIWANPYSFSQVLAVYSDECEPFTDYLNNRGCNVTYKWAGGKWAEGLRRHARALVSYRAAMQKMGVPEEKYIAYGLFPMPFHYYLKLYLRKIARGDVPLSDVISQIKCLLMK